MERLGVRQKMSTPHRFFARPVDYPDETEIVIEGDEFVHAKTVLRVEEGSEIVLLDNSGKEYTAIVVSIGKRSFTAHITGVNAGDKQAATDVYMLCGALKGDKTELVVQKATELGVSAIGVFRSRYCSAYFNENKVERLNKVAREATKQCLRSVAPEVKYFEDFESALASAAEYKNKLFACEFAGKSDVDLRTISGSTAIVVGSEGGFADEEYKIAKEKYNFAGITLGKRILRAETAAVSACAIVMFCLGEMQ